VPAVVVFLLFLVRWLVVIEMKFYAFGFLVLSSFDVLSLLSV
jgi:hypothetical protein